MTGKTGMGRGGRGRGIILTGMGTPKTSIGRRG